MRLTDLLSGSSFRTSAKVAIGVLVLMTVGGTLLIGSATKALREVTEQQTLEEAVLLSDVYAAEGREGLVKAIGTLSKLVSRQEHISTVYDEHGIHLAAPTSPCRTSSACATSGCNSSPPRGAKGISCCRSRSSAMQRWSSAEVSRPSTRCAFT